MGIVAIGIGIGIGISLGLVETVLHIFTEPNFIGIRIGVGVGIGVGQWKHTIMVHFHLYEDHLHRNTSSIFSRK